MHICVSIGYDIHSSHIRIHALILHVDIESTAYYIRCPSLILSLSRSTQPQVIGVSSTRPPHGIGRLFLRSSMFVFSSNCIILYNACMHMYIHTDYILHADLQQTVIQTYIHMYRHSYMVNRDMCTDIQSTTILWNRGLIFLISRVNQLTMILLLYQVGWSSPSWSFMKFLFVFHRMPLSSTNLVFR